MESQAQNVVKDLYIQLSTKFLVCVWLEIHSQIMPRVYRRYLWLTAKWLNWCTKLLIASVLRRAERGLGQEGPLHLKNILFHVFHEIKKSGSTEEAPVKRCDGMCVCECECAGWDWGTCGGIRKHKAGTMYNTHKDLGLGLPFQSPLWGHVFTGNLLTGLRPHVLFAHCSHIPGLASHQRAYLLWKQGGREFKSSGCEVHCLGLNTGPTAN